MGELRTKKKKKKKKKKKQDLFCPVLGVFCAGTDAGTDARNTHSQKCGLGRIFARQSDSV